jgi:SsrA-binding protein
MPEDEKVITTNKKAYHDFTVLQKIEAGVSLMGTEVKSVKSGHIDLRDGFGYIKGGQLYLRNVHISPYPFGNRVNHEPMRERKLLLHRDEIRRLHAKIKERGFTLVPLRVYVKRGLVKIEMGLVKGKRLFDKREAIQKRDLDREMKKNLKASNL